MPHKLLFVLPLAALACLVLGALTTPAVMADEQPAQVDLSVRIDAEIDSVLKRDKVAPAARSSDEEFLRRVYLDTVGEPPTYAEAVAFLDSTDAKRREKLIDQLLDDPRFGQHMANHWTALLTTRGAEALSGSHLFARWLASEFNADTGMNSIIHKIITAEGELADAPQIVPYFSGGDPLLFTDLAGKFSKNLMGVQIQCAECHDHHYDAALTQKSFQGMASFLTATEARQDGRILPRRVSVRTNPEPATRVLRAYAMYDKLTPDQKAQVDQYIDFVRPVTLDGDAIDTRNPAAWRGALADWMTAPDNPRTRRYLANRIWAIAFGSGLVNPVDDFNALNEASHPELLALLGEDLKDNGWSIKRLYRAILNSRTWQRSSRPSDAPGEAWHFARYPVRPLHAEQFLAALLRLLEDSRIAEIVKAARDDALKQARETLKKQEADQKKNGGDYYTFDHASLSRLSEQFMDMRPRWFVARWGAGRYVSLSQDDEMTEGETFTMSINQALAVMNGEFTNALAAGGPGSLLERITREFNSYEKRVNALYLTVLARRPTVAEFKRLEALFAKSENPSEAAEDLLFALLMSPEFATNH